MTRVQFLNCISTVFVVLSVLVCLVSLAWVTDTVSVPDNLRPKTEVPLPTPALLPGLPTAAPTVEASATPEEAVVPETETQEAPSEESTQASETP